MDTNTLRTFLSVAKFNSFSQAAEKLFLTQPAISKRIAALEIELHTRLFDRIGRNIVLTEAGQLFLNRAHIILRELEDSATEIENLSAKTSGSLAMATSHHIGLHRMPSILKDYTRTFPEVDLQIAFMDSESACAAVLQGEIELAVVTLPIQPIPHLQSKSIWSDKLDIVIANDHPHCTKISAQNNAKQLLTHLSKLPAILPKKRTFTRQIIEQHFQRQHLTLDVRLSTNYLETIKMLVKANMGWSVLPRKMLDKELTAIDTPKIKLHRELGVVWHAKRTQSNAAIKMMDLIGQS